MTTLDTSYAILVYNSHSTMTLNSVQVTLSFFMLPGVVYVKELFMVTNTDLASKTVMF